MTCDELK